jgi:hypothetical protein
MNNIKTFYRNVFIALVILTSCTESSNQKANVQESQTEIEAEVTTSEEYRLNNGTADDPPESRLAPDENDEHSLNDEEIEERQASNLPEINLEHNWQCYFCRVIIQKSETPERTVCKEAEAEQKCGGCTHSWKDLGECGSRTYQCYYCREIIKSKYKPLSVTCRVAEKEQSCGGCKHSWKEL